MKTCLCAIAKNENLYIKDWIEYHKNKGFNHIIIADNNDVNDDSLLLVISDYITNGYVIYEDYRGKQSYQNNAYMEIYRKHHKEFDWIAFWDVDEFIDGISSVNDFLSQHIFDKSNLVYLNWKCFGDSGRVMYEPIPVYQRFTIPYPKEIADPTWLEHQINSHIKSIVRCVSNDITFKVPHNARHNNIQNNACNAIGMRCNHNSPWQPILWEGAWLNHYCTLTIDEFFQRRMKRGRATTTKKRSPQELCNQFFIYNKNTKEKMEILKKYFNKVKTFKS